MAAVAAAAAAVAVPETVLELFFHSEVPRDRTPYILSESDTKYVCDGAEGSITFDGYYYVEDHAPPYPEDEALPDWKRPTRREDWLPKQLQLYVRHRETEPYKVEPLPPLIFDASSGITSCGGHSYSYRYTEERAYMIEIYRRVIHECTDRISEEEDDDGTPMRVCFFPTNLQTIYFRVLETIYEGGQRVEGGEN